MFRICESKVESSILNIELDMENYNSIKLDHWKRRGGFACNSIKPLCGSNKQNFCGDIESIFIDIIFPKSKPIWFGVLHWLPYKPEFIDYLDNSLKEGNICNIQVCCLLVDVNVNLLSRNKMLLKKLAIITISKVFQKKFVAEVNIILTVVLP